jgi:DNA-directed RNA polymerase II subunit RPB1
MKFQDIEEKKVKTIQFGILSPEEIKRFSVLNIESDLTFENNLPKMGGLMDSKLGAIDKELYCTTDFSSYIECPGYFGHLNLNKPVFHEGYMDFILLILRCIDHTDSRLILNPYSRRIKNVLKLKNPRQRLGIISKLCTYACGLSRLKKSKKNLQENLIDCKISLQPRYSRDGWCIIAKFDEVLTSEPLRVLTAERVYEILKNMTDIDCKIIGLNPKLSRPDWMILTVLPIPPPTVRPSVMFDVNTRAEDDLTFKLGDIIRTNKSLGNLIISCAPITIINAEINLLQYHIGTYMNNNVPSLAKSLQKSGRPIKSLKQRLQGKEGRVRGNLMGKRVDFSARTVITPDPNIKLEEIGVPWSIALNLTYPEIVSNFNLEISKKIIENGPNCHPGAKYLIRNDGNRIDLRFVRKTSGIKIEPGNQIERHLQDGDVVLFNRQPSLHKMSMMGHVVKIMHYSTFRLNLSATSPYNADFDGDEMNLHLPQTIEAKAELINLLLVPNCIVSQQGNKPVIGIVQDSLLGGFLLTKRDSFLTKSEFMLLSSHLENGKNLLSVPTILKPNLLWTGKQLISLIIPHINLSRVSLSHSEELCSDLSYNDTRVLIINGELLSGIIDKRTIGASNGSIIHVIWKEYGPEETTRFISQFQVIVNNWLIWNGFSVGIGDTISSSEINKNVYKIIHGAKKKVELVAKKDLINFKENLSNKIIRDTFENQINKLLNNARDMSGSDAQKKLADTNNIKIMVVCGSKGSFINISQIIACVGQQNIEGNRIPLNFKGRSLPHFKKFNTKPETRGFVENSYINGLNPSEFFFHSMGGREGLIDTAIKTSETGYIQRRLSKAMEDVSITYDLTVRDGQNGIIQFFYGEDGMDAAFLENKELKLVKMSDREMEATYRVNFCSPCIELDQSGFNFLNPEIKKTLHEQQNLLVEEFTQLLKDREDLRETLTDTKETMVPLPVNVDRILWNGCNLFPSNKCHEDQQPSDIIRGIKDLENYFIESLWPERHVTCEIVCNCPKCEIKENVNSLLRIHVRSSLSFKQVSFKHKLSKDAFFWVLNEICVQYRKAIASPGEMVGTIAAQSIGQPATQMTLNTFHYAGVSAKNVTLGVPRLKEIINVFKNSKTPSLTIYLHKHCSSSPKRVKRLQQALEYTSLKGVLDETQYIYDPDPFKTIFFKDRFSLERYFEIPDEIAYFSNYGPWVLKMTLRRDEFVDKKLNGNQLIEKINRKSKPLPLFITTSNENSEIILFRLRILWPGTNTDVIMKFPSFERRFLTRMNHYIVNMNIKDFGTVDLKRIYVRRAEVKGFISNSDGIVKKFQEFILDTEGTNLKYILNYNGIDFRRTLSNDIIEVCKILGIEATRKILIQELKNLISFDGSYVNFRHLALLVDIMTHKGKLISITRHGFNKMDVSPIARCTFEETVDILYQSAVFGICDDLKGVSSNIMVGNLAPIGTGSIDLFLSKNYGKVVINS